MFAATKLLHTFVRLFCRNKIMFFAKNICRDKNMFVATGILFSRQKQTRVCRDKTFVATKMILLAALANDTFDIVVFSGG